MRCLVLYAIGCAVAVAILVLAIVVLVNRLSTGVWGW